MKNIIAFLLFTCFSFSPVLRAEDALVPPSSELWDQLYDPPFKSPTEIPVESGLRKVLFDQLRPKIAAMLGGKPVQFKGSLKAFRNWAFFSGETLGKDGKPAAIGELENSDTCALWLRTVEGWKLVDFSGGHSDVFYEVWPEQYGVSRALLGFGE